MVTIEMINYSGWAGCVRLSNSRIHLVCTTPVGPRIIFFGFKEGENQFYENPAELGRTEGKEWLLYGGHRFWHAPEDPSRTYFPDNLPVSVENLADGVRLTAPVEHTTGIQKTIEIHLAPDLPRVVVDHILLNTGLWPVPLAPWGITVLRPGGVAVLPHPQRVQHSESLLPSHTLSLWGYTRMSDSRFIWGDHYLLLKQDPAVNFPQKIGMFNTCGWAAYICNGVAFLKKFDVHAQALHPDLNCNLESFTNRDSLELETLGPLELLQPGKTLRHRETWYLAENVPLPLDDEAVDRDILPLTQFC